MTDTNQRLCESHTALDGVSRPVWAETHQKLRRSTLKVEVLKSDKGNSQSFAKPAIWLTLAERSAARMSISALPSRRLLFGGDYP